MSTVVTASKSEAGELKLGISVCFFFLAQIPNLLDKLLEEQTGSCLAR